MSKTWLQVIDTETTGLETTDQMCELAIVTLEVTPSRRVAGRVAKETARWSSIIRPTCPVSPQGRAAHHITDEQMILSPSTAELLTTRGLEEFGIVDMVPLPDGARTSVPRRGDVVMVAHNLEFDVRMMLQSGVPEAMLPTRRVCTYRCARQAWPDAPGHSNQVLRYWLKLDVPQMKSLPPHRALPDALVTAAIACALLKMHSVEELEQMTTQPFVMQTCNLGEHAGKPWADVPHSFLNWLLAKGPRRPNPAGGRDIGFDDDTRHTAQHYLNGGK